MSFYGNLYRKILWPLYERSRGRHTHQRLAQARETQWSSPETLRERQEQELRSLLRHAYEHTVWYRREFERLQILPEDVQSVNDLGKLPLLSKDDIRQHRHEMRANGCRDRVYEHRTGGSTGVPLQFFINYTSYEWRRAVSLRGYGWAGAEEGDRQFYVWGAPIGTPPLRARVKVKAHNALLRREVFSSFGFSKQAMDDCARRIGAFHPHTVIGYTNALYLLAQHLLEKHITFPPPTAIITAAEGVNALQRQTIERAFGAPVFASYGSREFMLIAMECEKHKGFHTSGDNLLVEIIDAQGRPAGEGETGEIVITDLHNYGMPFIRYKIGDLGVATSRVCSCGRGLPLLERVEGRILDVIRTPDGRIVPGEFFPHLMKEFDVVKQFQVAQKQLDALVIKLVLRDGDATVQLQRIERELRTVLGTSITLTLQRVDEIPESASGKFRVTISEL